MANRNCSQPRDAARNGELEAAAADPLQMEVKGDGRDPTTGRFKPGWRGGKGNPLHRKMAELRKAALEEIMPDMMRHLFRYLYSRASQHCDVAAATLLLRYCLGRPPENPDDPDTDAPAEEQEEEELAAPTARA
jgi:hypothetical protein